MISIVDYSDGACVNFDPHLALTNPYYELLGSQIVANQSTGQPRGMRVDQHEPIFCFDLNYSYL